MQDGNPGEIDFGSSWRQVRVGEGSSYWELTVEIIQLQNFPSTFSALLFPAVSEFQVVLSSLFPSPLSLSKRCAVVSSFPTG